jgi:hypothetical protein
MSGILLPYMGIAGQMGYVPPSSIPNLSLWYNASASSTVVNGVTFQNFKTVVVNGTAIGAWTDLSGAGHDANVNGGTSKEPNYATPIQNGLGALLYTSANQENLDINPIAWMATLSGFSIYVLARPTVLPATQFPLTVTDTSTGMWWNGTNWSIGCTAGNHGTATVTNDTTKFHRYGMIFDGSQTGNANRLKFLYDGVSQSLTFTGTIPAATGTPAYFYFGGNNRSGGAGGALAGTYMDGYIGEIMIWTRTLTATEQINVDNYLKVKWNL